MPHLRHLRKYFFKYKYYLIFGIFITILARIFSLFMPEYVQNSIVAIEEYAKSTDKNSQDVIKLLIKYALIIIGTTIISAILTFFMRQLIINVSRYIEYDLKNEIFVKYEQLSQNFYKKNRTGDLMNRISEDVGKVRTYAGPAIMYSVQTITLFVCVIPIMFYTSVELTLYALIPLPILSALIYTISRKINRETTKVQEFLSDLSTFSQEIFTGIGVVKSYNTEKMTNEQISDLAEIGMQKNMKLAKTQAIFAPTLIFLIGLSLIFVIFMGGRLYYLGEITSVGVIVKFSIYVTMLSWPVATVGWVSSIVQQAEASQKRINEFLSEVPDIQSITNEKTTINGEIRFENVSFTYADTGIEAVKNMSFHIKKGEKIAIVGKTGCGKSTIIDLISRIYDANEGQIFIDEKPIEKIHLESLRRAISVVPQESFLFSDTIKNNLLFANKQATDNQIVEATKKAVVHHNIMDFTHQYDSVLGERGVSLSGGQKQRICIARALLKEASIYLLDDCLSAVDTDTEEKILNNLKNSLHDKTLIIVSHRISIAKTANRIFMLNDGALVEEGTHEELFAKNGYYRAFYDSQMV